MSNNAKIIYYRTTHENTHTQKEIHRHIKIDTHSQTHIQPVPVLQTSIMYGIGGDNSVLIPRLPCSCYRLTQHHIKGMPCTNHGKCNNLLVHVWIRRRIIPPLSTQHKEQPFGQLFVSEIFPYAFNPILADVGWPGEGKFTLPYYLMKYSSNRHQSVSTQNVFSNISN